MYKHRLASVLGIVGRGGCGGWGGGGWGGLGCGGGGGDRVLRITCRCGCGMNLSERQTHALNDR